MAQRRLPSDNAASKFANIGDRTNGRNRPACVGVLKNARQDVRAPTRRGFGTVVIEKMLRGVGGTVKFNWHATGLECQIFLPEAVLAEKMSPA